MNTATAGVIFLLSLLAVLAVAYRYLGDYMYRVVTGTKHSAVERGIYKAMGVDPAAEQSWGTYARSLLAFSAVSLLGLYAFLRLQDFVFAIPDFENGVNDRVWDHLAWNTAVSFTTNTNWQAYSGESTMTHFVQAAGLAVQNFVSAAVGIAVAVALVRGFARSRTDRLGNFWVDLTRITLRILLPISAVAAVLLILGGVVQSSDNGTMVSTLTGGEQHLTGGPAKPFLATYRGVSVECGKFGEDYAGGVLVPIRGDAPAVPVVPPDAVAASASGLDPHISVAYAKLQAPRVAKERGLAVEKVLELIAEHTTGRVLGFMGEPGVNVLQLNVALDNLGG